MSKFAILGLTLALLAAGCTAAAPKPQPPACTPEVRTDELPVWARAGFSEGARVPYSLGRSGQIVAVLFGFPLKQPPEEGRNNKILWVASPLSKAPQPRATDLVIDARLEGTGDPVRRQVDGGPGPSIVDLPRAGCWRLALSWAGRTDTVDLAYGTP